MSTGGDPKLDDVEQKQQFLLVYPDNCIQWKFQNQYHQCCFLPGGPSSPPLQPHDQATGGVRVAVCLAAGHHAPGSYAGLQPHQGQRQHNPVLLLHVLQRGVASHHHPGGHASHPHRAGVHLPDGHAAVLLHPDLQLPEGTTYGQTRQSAQGDASVHRHRHSIHGMLSAHHGDNHRSVDHPLVPPVGLHQLLQIHPAQHRVSGFELPELGPGSHHLHLLKLHIQEGPGGCAALCTSLWAGRGGQQDVFFGNSVDHPGGDEIHED